MKATIDRQYVGNKWAWPYSNKTSFVKTDNGLDLSTGQLLLQKVTVLISQNFQRNNYEISAVRVTA